MAGIRNYIHFLPSLTFSVRSKPVFIYIVPTLWPICWSGECGMEVHFLSTYDGHLYKTTRLEIGVYPLLLSLETDALAV